MPKISVVVPVYNVGNYIKPCVTSICKQTIKDFEIIIINDGSTDNSIAIAKNVLENYNISFLIIDQVNLGISAARNTGINAASGEWVVCVDSDDYIHPQFLEMLLINAEKNNCDISSTGFASRNASLESDPNHYTKVDSVVYNNSLIAKFFLKRKLKIIVPGLLIKLKSLRENNIQYNVSNRFTEDLEYVWLLIKSFKRWAILEKPLYYYISRPGSIMHTLDVEKVMSGYQAFLDLGKEFNVNSTFNFLDSRFIVPRWVIATLRTATKVHSYNVFEHIANRLDYKIHAKTLLFFPDIRIKTMAVIILLNLSLFYQLIGIGKERRS